MAETYDITIDQGSDYFLTIYIQNMDGSAYDIEHHIFRAQVRKKFKDVYPLCDFSWSIIDDEEGELRLSIPNSVTEDMPPGEWVWDVEMVRPDLTVKRLLQGKAIVTAEVTKPWDAHLAVSEGKIEEATDSITLS